MSSLVAYYRVSTAQQGRSGLGLDSAPLSLRSPRLKASSLLPSSPRLKPARDLTPSIASRS
jgi:hypothetical protein